MLEISFSHRPPSPARLGALKTASPQPASDSEHKTCLLPVVGFGAIPRILPGSRCSQIALRQQENPAIMAQKILPKHRPAVSGQLPRLSPTSSPRQISLLLSPAPKETSTELSPVTYATLLQKYEIAKCKGFAQLPPFNNSLIPPRYGNKA